MTDVNEPKDKITDALVEQSLLDNIDLTLDEVRPESVDLEETHIAVITYKEFQQALLTKSGRIEVKNHE